MTAVLDRVRAGGRPRPRETEAPRLAAGGHTNGQIARRMSASPDTMQGVIRWWCRQFGAPNRAAVARVAVDARLLPIEGLGIQ